MEGAANQFPDDSDGLAAALPDRTMKTIVQQCFKSDEQVHMIFEAYQIRGQEHFEGLLALVSSISGGTYAIISFTVLRTPLTASNELKINKVFPINRSFQLTDTKGSISDHQFHLSSDDGRPSKYFYHPFRTEQDTPDFAQFCAEIDSCKRTIGEFEMTSDTTLNFRWLDDYREIGEVKQELKKRESQYILYKDITVYCATWNVNNKPCDLVNSSLYPWLGRSEEAPDIYAIGLQELNTQAKQMINANQMQTNATHWM